MQEDVLWQGIKDTARLCMHLPPYVSVMECGSHLAHRKPSGFSFYLSPWGNKRCQPGQHLLPGEPSPEQGQQRLSCCCRCALGVSRTGSLGGRFPAWTGSWECAARSQQGGATTQTQPTAPQSSFGNCLTISKRKLSAAHTTGLY